MRDVISVLEDDEVVNSMARNLESSGPNSSVQVGSVQLPEESAAPVQLSSTDSAWLSKTPDRNYNGHLFLLGRRRA